MADKYTIQLSLTSDGLHDYMQIMSKDMVSTNIVLIGKFELQDTRPKPKPTIHELEDILAEQDST